MKKAKMGLLIIAIIVMGFILMLGSPYVVKKENNDNEEIEFKTPEFSYAVQEIEYSTKVYDNFAFKQWGINSNFSAMGNLDGIYNNLSEQNSNPYSYEMLWVNYEDYTWYDWTYGWTKQTPYLDNADYPDNASVNSRWISEITKDNQEGWFYFENTTLTGSSIPTTLFVRAGCDGGQDDYIEFYIDWTGSGGGSLAGTITPLTITPTLAWYNISLGNHSYTELNNARFYIIKKNTKGANSLLIDAVYLKCEETPLINYEIDMEYYFELEHFWDYEYLDLRIYINSIGNEQIYVQNWDDLYPAGYETVFTNLSVGWNNATMDLWYWSGDEGTIRFLTNNSLSDSVQDSWEIDEMFILLYNITVGDNDPPTWDTITESADPLELGNNETIGINIYDASSLSYVYLQFGGSNHSMSFISGNTYQYSKWKPTYTGLKYYKIYMSDIYGNKNETGIYNITVIDTTPPIIENITESADPLYLGNNETISCDVFDYSTILFVYLEFAGSNHSMVFISGNTYSYSNWQPGSIGLKNYTIYAKDNETNINWYNGNITVIEYVGDNDPPTWDTLLIFYDPLEVKIFQIIRINVYDATNISFVYIEFDGKNHSMSLIYNDTYTYEHWKPRTTGIKNFTIWMCDYYGNMNFTSGSFLVISSSKIFGGIIFINFLMILMIFLYDKLKEWIIILTIFLFSLIFGIGAMSIISFPLTPYFQIGFILFQAIGFILSSFKEYNKRR